SKGVYDQKALQMEDTAITTAQSTGAKIIMMVNETPQWASGSTNRGVPPSNPADYAAFMHAMVARYAGKVAAWEIWNEENTSRFWAPNPDAAGYAALLKAAYPAVKSADPNTKVLFGGL